MSIDNSPHRGVETAIIDSQTDDHIGILFSLSRCREESLKETCYTIMLYIIILSISFQLPIYQPILVSINYIDKWIIWLPAAKANLWRKLLIELQHLTWSKWCNSILHVVWSDKIKYAKMSTSKHDCTELICRLAKQKNMILHIVTWVLGGDIARSDSKEGIDLGAGTGGWKSKTL